MPRSASGQHEWVTKRDAAGETYQECLHCAVRSHWAGSQGVCTRATISKWLKSAKKKAREAKKAKKAKEKDLAQILEQDTIDPGYHEIK